MNIILGLLSFVIGIICTFDLVQDININAALGTLFIMVANLFFSREINKGGRND